MQKTIQATFEDRWQVQRYIALKEESMSRIGTDEMTHAAFLTLLLDVWEHQMEADAGDFEPNVIVEQREERRDVDIVRDTGVFQDGQNA